MQQDEQRHARLSHALRRHKETYIPTPLQCWTLNRNGSDMLQLKLRIRNFDGSEIAHRSRIHNQYTLGYPARAHVGEGFGQAIQGVGARNHLSQLETIFAVELQQ